MTVLLSRLMDDYYPYTYLQLRGGRDDDKDAM